MRWPFSHPHNPSPSPSPSSSSTTAPTLPNSNSHAEPPVETPNPDPDPESASTSPKPSTTSAVSARIRRHLRTEVSTHHADLLLLVCCLLSGLVDSTIYNAFGTFVSMQTGNTIFIGLGSSTTSTTTKPYGWAKSLTSVICFTIGAFFFSRLSRLLHPLRRGTLATSFLLQSILIITATSTIQSGAIDGTVARTIAASSSPTTIDWKSLVPIILLSFQSAGQLVGSRVLDLSEIPTVVVTSLLCDLASDPALFRGPLTANAKRNRRVVAFGGILVGAVAGGWISKATGEIQTALWIAAGVKVGIAVSWLVWPGRS